MKSTPREELLYSIFLGIICLLIAFASLPSVNNEFYLNINCDKAINICTIKKANLFQTITFEESTSYESLIPQKKIEGSGKGSRFHYYLNTQNDSIEILTGAYNKYIEFKNNKLQNSMFIRDKKWVSLIIYLGFAIIGLFYIIKALFKFKE